MLKSIQEINEIHVGQVIKSLLDERSISYAEFAEFLNCERASVYYLFQVKSMDIEKLIKISRYLNYDIITNTYYKQTEKSFSNPALLVSLTEEQVKELKKCSLQEINISDLLKETI